MAGEILTGCGEPMVTVLVGEVTDGIVGVVVTVLFVSLVAGILVCTAAVVSSVLAAVFSDEALPQPVTAERKNRDAIKLMYFMSGDLVVL